VTLWFYDFQLVFHLLDQHSMNFHHDFSPKFLPLKVTNQRLTSTGGLQTLMEAFDNSKLKEPFANALPERKSRRSQGAYRLGLIQVASFLRGHDCLADLEEFRNDPLLSEVMQGETVAPRTMGDFLRDFDSAEISKMNSFLSTQAKSYRLQLEKMLKKRVQAVFGAAFVYRFNRPYSTRLKDGRACL
jgi:hypothetical protein